MKKMHAATDRFSEHPVLIRVLIPVLSVLVASSAILVPTLLGNNISVLTSDLDVRYTAGSIADQDVKATETFHYIDDGESRRRQQEANRSVLPRFRISLIPSREMLSDIETVFTGTGTISTAVPAILLQRIASLSELDRTALHELVRLLVQEYVAQGIFDPHDLIAVRDQGYRELQLERRQEIGVSELDKVIALQEVFHTGMLAQRLHEDMSILGTFYREGVREIAFDVVNAIIRPNVHLDPVATAIARQEASRAVEPVVVRIEKGQYIVKQDFVITDEDIRTLQAMRLASVQFSPSQQFGRVGFVLAVTVSALYGMYLVFHDTRRRYQYLVVFLGGVLITQWAMFVIISWFSQGSFITMDPFLPAYALPILMALMTNRKRSGMVASLLIASYAVLLPSSHATTLFFLVAVSFCGIYFIRYVSRRIDMIMQLFFGVLAASFLVVFNNLINGFPFVFLPPSIVVISANMAVTYVLVTVMLPVIEYAFNLPTPFRLRELAFSDSPVLARLSQTATGTYNHSLVVSEMAYAAAKEIQADPLLARVGALYHDVGKQEHPEYFIENQSGDNKHDELKASLSVAIIKSHVKIGVEKGREARLPQEVLDIISQHHGNDVIAIFLKEAQTEAQNNKDHRPVSRQDYAYNNQIPQTPEAAIVMLADSVEAASRTVKKPSAQRYEKLVNQIIMGKIERKQLGSSQLSLTDLEILERVFVQILTGRYHNRIDYPDAPAKERI